MRNWEKRWLTQRKHAYWLFWQLKRPSDRKLLLYACACHRRIRDLLDDQCRQAAELIERRAEGLAGADEVAEAHRRMRSLIMRLQYQQRTVDDPWEGWEEGDEHQPTDEQVEAYEQAVREAAVPEMRYYAALCVNHGLCKPTTERAYNTAGCAAGALGQRQVAAGKSPTRLEAAEERWSCDLVREIFPNPFRPQVTEVGRLPREVVKLAQGIYAGRAFDGMPALADALEEAGCTNADVLGHCRAPVEHVRGCWALDAVLGRK